MNDARANELIAGMMGWKGWPECHDGLVCPASTPLNQCTYDRVNPELPSRCLNATPPRYCTRPDLLASVEAAFEKRQYGGTGIMWDVLPPHTDGWWHVELTTQKLERPSIASQPTRTAAICHAIAQALEGEGK